MYYRGANAALLLYDITNSSTFDDVRGWLEGKVLFCQIAHGLLLVLAPFGKSDLWNLHFLILIF